MTKQYTTDRIYFQSVAGKIAWVESDGGPAALRSAVEIIAQILMGLVKEPDTRGQPVREFEAIPHVQLLRRWDVGNVAERVEKLRKQKSFATRRGKYFVTANDGNIEVTFVSKEE